MFEKAEDRLSKENIASKRASISDRADNHARGYLADARAKGDKRPEEIVLFEGRNDYLTKVQQAQLARVGVAGEQVATTIEDKITSAWKDIDKAYIVKEATAKPADKPALEAQKKREKDAAAARIRRENPAPAGGGGKGGSGGEKPALPPGFKPDKT
jgi:hypothetical protein